MTRRSPLRVSVSLAVASAAVMSLGGCMTVHGERELTAAATKADAAKALQNFVRGYNASNRTLNARLNSGYETGSLLELDQAQTRQAHAVLPKGNPGFHPLVLSQPHYTIPEQAGWPRYFVVDALSNRKATPHWYLAFTRDGPQEKWRAAYLQAFGGRNAPKFATNAEGYAEPVPLRAGEASRLTVDPARLPAAYADYLDSGKGAVFAPGPATTGWRGERSRLNNQPGQNLQWEDLPTKYPPIALRLKNGGALVFFSTNVHQKKTLPTGSVLTISPSVKAILKGSAKRTNQMTFTSISEQVAQVPPKGADGKVTILNWLTNQTSATAL